MLTLNVEGMTCNHCISNTNRINYLVMQREFK
ncbi:hypothetical protein SHDE107825_18855 [Shewanella denitrificans]